MKSTAQINLSLLACLLMSSSVTAATKKSHKADQPTPPSKELSLREKALMENEVPTGGDKAIETAPPANTSPATIKIKELEPLKLKSGWLWNMNVIAQSYTPQGRGEIRNTSTYNLSEVGTAVLPELNIGAMPFSFEVGSASLLYLGLSAGAGYMVQEAKLTTPAGYAINEARLATAIYHGGLAFGYKPAETSKWGFWLDTHYGELNHTMTSTTSIAQFSTQKSFTAVTARASYNLIGNWGLSLAQTMRNGTDIQSQDTQLGISSTW